MYKATHAYTADQDHILSFSAGESLCILEKNNDAWWLASDGNGKVGYIPTSYVKKEQNDSNDVVLQSVNNAIAEILASAPAGSLPPKQQALLKKLVSHKESLVASVQKSRPSSTKRRAPPPPPPVHSDTTADLQEVKKPPAVPVRVHSLSKFNSQQCDTESVSSSVKHEVPQDIGTQLIGVLKATLQTDDNKSRNAVSALLETMKSNIPSLENVFDEILQTLPQEKGEDKADDLRLALENLREIKDDAQQRNWAIEDDEDKIMEILNEILKHLTTLDKESNMRVISYDHFLPIHTLVEYHQMETRVSLRLVILQIFGALCSLSKTMVSTLLATVLPLELAMDIMAHTEDTQRASYSCLVMTMLFSTAEPMPVGHYDRLNNEFIEYLIKYIEDELPDSVQDDQVAEMFINVLLSFNLHMQIPTSNMVMQVIAERETCTMLSEKLMVLLNRGDDPVVMEEHWEDGDHGRPPPSVLKFFQDIFSQRSTSTFLYTNDMNVLIDIITRNLTDLASGDKLRTDYLDLLLNILMNTNYADSRHRAVDIEQSLGRILGEEQPDTEAERQVLDFDKRIVESIFTNFGHLFP